MHRYAIECTHGIYSDEHAVTRESAATGFIFALWLWLFFSPLSRHFAVEIIRRESYRVKPDQLFVVITPGMMLHRNILRWEKREITSRQVSFTLLF